MDIHGEYGHRVKSLVEVKVSLPCTNNVISWSLFEGVFRHHQSWECCAGAGATVTSVLAAPMIGVVPGQAAAEDPLKLRVQEWGRVSAGAV